MKLLNSVGVKHHSSSSSIENHRGLASFKRRNSSKYMISRVMVWAILHILHNYIAINCVLKKMRHIAKWKMVVELI